MYCIYLLFNQYPDINSLGALLVYILRALCTHYACHRLDTYYNCIVSYTMHCVERLPCPAEKNPRKGKARRSARDLPRRDTKTSSSQAAPCASPSLRAAGASFAGEPPAPAAALLQGIADLRRVLWHRHSPTLRTASQDDDVCLFFVLFGGAARLIICFWLRTDCAFLARHLHHSIVYCLGTCGMNRSQRGDINLDL